ncbi:MAG TPA: sigma-70 family RNA polymerase sigma factor [Candidatus Limnocylindria bacterium]|nr:sigma-70 family RNA polymerase sigma factor [Candidatus Limnocylindria bacterium]
MGTRSETLAERFERMMLPHERQVYGVCLHMMGQAQDAEDCAQEAMLRAFRAFDSFRGDSSPSTWTYSIAVRVCLDALRKRKQVYSLDLLREGGFDVPDGAPDAYARLEDKERRRLLKAAIAELPPDFRAAQVLVDVQGLSYPEAAEALGLPLGTVKSRVHRARQALQQILLRDGELFAPSLRLRDERRERDAL